MPTPTAKKPKKTATGVPPRGPGPGRPPKHHSEHARRITVSLPAEIGEWYANYAADATIRNAGAVISSGFIAGLVLKAEYYRATGQKPGLMEVNPFFVQEDKKL